MIPVPLQTAQAKDWQRLYREAISDPRELLAMLDLGHLDGLLPQGDYPFPLRVPAGFIARMRRGDAADPLLRQVLPLDAEYRAQPGFVFDAVGDGASRSARGVLHKYQGRALLLASGSCAIHCRYCFRRHFPYAEEPAAAAHWASTIDYLAQHGDVQEIILSGGDPLSLATGKLKELTERLRATAQIRRLRIHTRLPVVLPERVDAELLGWLSALPWRVVIVLHANHAQELDGSVAEACRQLGHCGALLLNQSVLLRGVNDHVDTLEALSERLFEIGVLPYYLHQLDRVHGAAHFEVDDPAARALVNALAARLPGFLVPRLVREIEGEPAKTPL